MRAHEDADCAQLRTKWAESQAEFHAINPIFWGDLQLIPPDMGFKRIWPLEPSSAQEGGTIIRFSALAEYWNVSARVRHIGTKKSTTQTQKCQIAARGRVETFMRITFPTNGKYEVTASISTPEGNWLSARERIYTATIWQFDVSAPGPARRIYQMASGNAFMPVVCPDSLQINPNSSLIRVSETVYEFTCTFVGKLQIWGCALPPPGEEPTVRFDPEIKVVSSAGRRSSQQCRLVFPSAGT
jgi:hypothetical protein